MQSGPACRAARRVEQVPCAERVACQWIFVQSRWRAEWSSCADQVTVQSGVECREGLVQRRANVEQIVSVERRISAEWVLVQSGDWRAEWDLMQRGSACRAAPCVVCMHVHGPAHVHSGALSHCVSGSAIRLQAQCAVAPCAHCVACRVCAGMRRSPCRGLRSSDFGSYGTLDCIYRKVFAARSVRHGLLGGRPRV